MKLLIDTHILLWLLTGNSRLSPDLYDMSADRQHTVFVRAISVWEIATKVSLGKLNFPPRLREWLPAEISAAGLLLLPIQVDDAPGRRTVASPPHGSV